jgi:uncharacterized SAM-binding protein YcdF (DUF218 family)
MAGKKIVSLALLLVSILFFIAGNSITGAAIGLENFRINLATLLGFTFLFLSLFVLLVKQSLDAIIIPIGNIREDVERAEQAAQNRDYLKSGERGFYVISGSPGNNLRGSGTKRIYDTLRGYGIKPNQMRIEGKSQDTIENLLNSLDLLKKKGAKEVGVATNRTHYWRFKEIEERAKREGIISEDFRLYPIQTREDFGQFFYGLLAYLSNRYRLRHGTKVARQSKIPSPIKGIARIFR